MFKEMFTTLDETNTKEYDYIKQGFLPITNSIMNRLSKLEKIEKTYRIEDISGYKRLVKNQNSKKAINTFTKGSSLLSKGLENEAELLVELSGNIVLEGSLDFETDRDRNGTLWINPTNNKVFAGIGKRLKILVENILTAANVNKHERGYAFSKLDDLDGKTKKTIIKKYYEGVESILEISNLKKIAKEMKHSGIYHNELIVNEYTINAVYEIVQKGERPKKKMKTDGEVSGSNIQAIYPGKEIYIFKY